MDPSFCFVSLMIACLSFVGGMVAMGQLLDWKPTPTKPVKKWFPGEPDPQPYDTPNWDLPGVHDAEESD